MSGGTKTAAYTVFAGMTMEERREAAAFLVMLNNFSGQALAIVTTASVDAGDSCTKREGTAGVMHIGDGDPDDRDPENTLSITKDGKVVDGDVQLHDDDMPPEIKMLILAAKAMGVEVQAEKIYMGSGTGSIDEIMRLQDEYEADDPIKEIARRLDKLPGSKRPKLPPKKIPEA
jgi:hypothetical protein